MVDLVILFYFFYGLFFSGTKLKDVYDFIYVDENGVELKNINTTRSTILLFITLAACVCLWPFVMGVYKVMVEDDEKITEKIDTKI